MAIARLRSVIDPPDADGQARLRTVRGGYLLSVGPGELDAEVFERLVHEGLRTLESGDAAHARQRLQAALALWRGPPLAQVALEEFALPEIRRLEELHLSALEARIHAELQLGEHARLTPELESLVTQNPTRERVTGYLMTALYRSGRQADALGVYQRARKHLVEDLGLEPGPELRALQREILDQAPSLNAPPPMVTLVAVRAEMPTGQLRPVLEGGGFGPAPEVRVARETLAGHGGLEVDAVVEGMWFAFANARDAVLATLALHHVRSAYDPADGPEPYVRIGIHTGRPRVLDGTYWGEDVHYAAHIAAAANIGQTLVSSATASLVPDAGLADLGDHRLRDFPVPRRLFQVGRHEHPPPRTVNHGQSNLPSIPGALIGREDELGEIVAALRDGATRLLTVSGAGGIGKTRLALAAAEVLRSELRGGAFFVPLADTATVDEVTAAIAGALGIWLSGADDPIARIVASVSERALLLVLDNFEHMLDAASVLSSLLASVPQMRLLVTSQAPLRTRAERVVTLTGLSSPDRDTPESVTASPAGRLLCRRAADVAPNFQLSPSNAPAVAGLCRALGGLPLAIELAAARLAALSPEDLLFRVQDGIDALGRGQRDLPPRQRGLRAALDRTHSMLDAAQAAVLRRMGVFQGPVALDRIERVCGDSLDIIEALADLVDLSLVIRAGDGRLGLHPTVRAFAREKLEEAGETREFARRHGEAFASAATAWGRRLLLAVDAVQAAATAEETDLAQALTWANREDPECFALTAGGASMTLVLNSRIGRWRAPIEEAIEAGVKSPEAHAWLLLAGSLAALHGADAALAQARIGQAIDAAEESGDRRLSCLMSTCSVLNQTMSEPTDNLTAEYAELCRRADRLCDAEYATLVRGIEPYVLRCQGRAEEAEPSFHDLVQARWRTDFPARMAVYDWPDCLLAKGDFDGALAAYAAALQMAHDRRETVNAAYQMDGAAITLSALGRYRDALWVAGAADSLHRLGGPIVAAGLRPRLDAALEQCRATLGRPVSEAAYVEGRTLLPDDAASAVLALTDLQGPGVTPDRPDGRARGPQATL